MSGGDSIRDWLSKKLGTAGATPTTPADAPGAAPPTTNTATPTSAPQTPPAMAAAAPGGGAAAPETQDPDELRRIRLQRFAAASPNSPPATTAATGEQPVKRAKPDVPAASAPVAVAVAAAGGATAPRRTDATTPTRVTPAAAQSVSPARRPAATTPTNNNNNSNNSNTNNAAVAAQSPVDVLSNPAEWVSEEIALVLRVTPGARPRPGLLTLPLAGPLLRADQLDVAFMARLHAEPAANALPFLYGCWARAKDQTDKTLNRRDAERMLFLAQLVRVTLHYAGLTLHYPHAMEAPDCGAADQPAALAACLAPPAALPDALERRAFALDVLRHAPDDALAAVAPLCAHALARALRGGDAEGDGPALLRGGADTMREPGALAELCALARTASALTAARDWLAGAATGGRALQTQSLLGPFFALSPHDDDARVGDACFLNVSAREAAPALERVRARLFALHGTLHTAVVALLKHRPAHAPMLAWLTAAVSLNAPRATMRPAWQTLATHGFALNVAAVLARLAEPIKVAAVDANYVVVNGDGFECGAAQTRLVYTDKQLAARAAELQARADKTEPSFHTRVFWLAARAAGVGWRPAAQMFSNMQSALSERDAVLERLSEQLGRGGGRAVLDELESLQYAVRLLRKDTLALECHARHPQLLAHLCVVYDIAARWMSAVAEPDARGLWPAEPRPEFAALPQWLLDDLAFFYEWLAHHAVDVFVAGAHHAHLITFITQCVASDSHVHNPYLRGRLVETLRAMLPHVGNTGGGPALPADLFARNRVAAQHLAPALMRFYVDVERTGGHNQFYDKFSIRYHTAAVLEYLWHEPSGVFRSGMEAYCLRPEQFLRFVTLLTNDATFLLDEALHKMEEIHELERVRADAAQWGALTQEQQQEKADALQKLVGAARSYNLLAQSSMTMFRYLSGAVVAPFMAPELVDRQAAMLNYFLVALAGPKCADLKVRDPAAVSFDPRLLLRTLCQIYCHLHSAPAFAAAVVRDARSYKPDVFAGAAAILRYRIAGVAADEAARFDAFVADCARCAAQLVAAEPWTDDDIPDEFKDALMATLMRDPVQWGTDVVCDRAIITRQLLQDPIDPYTRQPLTPDMLVPVPELRTRIEAWMAERMAAAAAGKK